MTYVTFYLDTVVLALLQGAKNYSDKNQKINLKKKQKKTAVSYTIKKLL